MTETGLTYRDAGVDIDAGDELVERIKPVVKRTMRKEVLAGIGGFGALVEVPLDRYRKPVLVSGTDGVGTKLRLAIDTGRHDKIGIDLVAMCANDIAVSGAEPLFFLDYYATGKLRVDVAEAVIRGIAEGCELAGAALVGGETAEMPGMYHGDDYDLAGFCVGVVERDRIIDGTKTAAGDVVIGLASSGPHSNGYSLIRKLVSVAGADDKTQLDGKSLFDRLLDAHAHLREVDAGAGAEDQREGLRAHHRRRPHRQHSARAARRLRSRRCSGAAGRAIRCSTGWPPPARSRPPRCTARSTAASAWSSWSRRPMSTRRWRSSRPRAKPPASSAASGAARAASSSRNDRRCMPVAVVISGRGSNMEAIARASLAPGSALQGS